MLKKILKLLFYALIIMVTGITLWWWYSSPGKADPIKDTQGRTIPRSISVIDTVQVHGNKQYLIIRGVDSTKPIILFVHGGPGGPEIGMMKETNQRIENDFVMVYWEQRGAGKSYTKHIPAESMTLSQFIADTEVITRYLMQRFHKDKINIMGHSWGTLLATMAAYKYPQYFHAYFGVGQIGNQYQGERVSFEWVKEQASAHHDKKAITELNKLTFPDSLAGNAVWDEFLAVERKYVMKFGGGATHQLTSILPLVKMIFLTPEYTLAEKFNYLEGSSFSIQYLWPEVINTNLFSEIDSVQVPFYILQGYYDYQTPYPVAKDFFNHLKAPVKGFFLFENSAHSPNMEEVEKFNAIVRERAK